MVKIIHLILCVLYHNKERDHKRTSTLMSRPESLPMPHLEVLLDISEQPQRVFFATLGCLPIPSSGTRLAASSHLHLPRARPAPPGSVGHLTWEGAVCLVSVDWPLPLGDASLPPSPCHPKGAVCTDGISSTPCRSYRHESRRRQAPQPAGFPSGLSTAYLSRKPRNGPRAGLGSCSVTDTALGSEAPLWFGPPSPSQTCGSGTQLPKAS